MVPRYQAFPQNAQEKAQFRVKTSGGRDEPEQPVQVTPERRKWGEPGCREEDQRGAGFRQREVSHLESSGRGATYSVGEA